jgi:hypothetical protein
VSDFRHFPGNPDIFFPIEVDRNRDGRVLRQRNQGGYEFFEIEKFKSTKLPLSIQNIPGTAA